MRISTWLGAAILVSGVPAAAEAQVLNFEGIGSTTVLDLPFILSFYNGGTSSIGTSGTNYGISFSDNAVELCLNTLTITCSNTSRGGVGDPGSQHGALGFQSSGLQFVTLAAGFTTGFSFYYADFLYTGARFTVYDGIDGTGSALASLLLGLTPDGETACSGYSAGFGKLGSDFCPYVAAGVTFSGTAKSVVFSGVLAEEITLDDVTFGSSTPGQLGGGPGSVVPEPATMTLMATGLVGIVGAGLRRRKVLRRD